MFTPTDRRIKREDVSKKMRTELDKYEEATNKQFDAQTIQLRIQLKIDEATRTRVENETRGPIAQVAYDGESYEKYLDATYGVCT